MGGRAQGRALLSLRPVVIVQLCPLRPATGQAPLLAGAVVFRPGSDGQADACHPAVRVPAAGFLAVAAQRINQPTATCAGKMAVLPSYRRLVRHNGRRAKTVRLADLGNGFPVRTAYQRTNILRRLSLE